VKEVLFVLETSGAAGQDNNRALVYRQRFEEAQVSVRYVGHEPQHPAWILYPKSRVADKVGRSLTYAAYAWLSFKILRMLNRWRILRAARKSDVVFLIKVSSLDLIKKIRSRSRARLIYDLGDALWLPTFSRSYGQINQILSAVDAVTSDNRYGVEYAARFSKEVHLWGAYPQIETFDRLRRAKPSAAGKPLIIGWLGSPGTLYNLFEIWEALEDVFKKHPTVTLSLVGAGTDPKLRPPFENVRYTVCSGYTNEEMFNKVLDMDIGLFPMFDVENSRVRGIMKALVYMSGEAAAISSPRGLCAELIKDGENGFLADSRREWVDKLDRLVQDATLRKKLTAEALKQVRERYSMDRVFGELRKILQV
jgi:glycosyltransferase involved in cell wall biosynthesis